MVREHSGWGVRPRIEIYARAKCIIGHDGELAYLVHRCRGTC